jgi:hypothetical protein
VKEGTHLSCDPESDTTRVKSSGFHEDRATKMVLDMNRRSGQKGRPEIDKRKEEPAKRAGVKEDG